MTDAQAHAFLDRLRTLFGLSSSQARQVLDRVLVHHDDPVAAAYHLDAQALAIHVRGGPGAREAWNTQWANARAASLQGPEHQALRADAAALLSPPA